MLDLYLQRTDYCIIGVNQETTPHPIIYWYKKNVLVIFIALLRIYYIVCVAVSSKYATCLASCR